MNFWELYVKISQQFDLCKFLIYFYVKQTTKFWNLCKKLNSLLKEEFEIVIFQLCHEENKFAALVISKVMRSIWFLKLRWSNKRQVFCLISGFSSEFWKILNSSSLEFSQKLSKFWSHTSEGQFFLTLKFVISSCILEDFPSSAFLLNKPPWDKF